MEETPYTFLIMGDDSIPITVFTDAIYTVTDELKAVDSVSKQGSKADNLVL